MQYRTLGKTELSVSVAGLGGGGESHLGLKTGSTEKEAVEVVKSAFDLGVNFFDTSDAYGTEQVMGKALEKHRDEVIISSKFKPRLSKTLRMDGIGLRQSLVESLRQLRTDYIDVYLAHRLRLVDYDYCANELVPELEQLRDEGKLRFFGISENTGTDPNHDMLQRATADDCWDIVMVAFNLLNQSARQLVFPQTLSKNIAVAIMIAARNHFNNTDRFAKELVRLVESGEIEAGRIDITQPLAGLTEFDAMKNLTEVSYRFASHEPGAHVVVVGTGNIDHLKQNVAALNAGPLASDLRDQLVDKFGDLTIAVQVPGRKKKDF